MSGLKAFKYRFKNCRTGAYCIKNPITEKLEIILPNNQILEEKEISERFIRSNKLTLKP